MPRHDDQLSTQLPKDSGKSAEDLPARAAFTVRVTAGEILAREDFEEKRSERSGREGLVISLYDEIVSPSLLRNLRRMNSDRSEELLRTDCLIAIDRLIGSYDPTRCPALDRYVASYLKNRVIDLWREEGRKPSIALLDAPEKLVAKSPPQEGALEIIIQRLSPVQQKMVEARLRGAKYSDIAAELGISESRLYAELRDMRARQLHIENTKPTPTDFERFVAHLMREGTPAKKLQLGDYARSPEFFERYLQEMQGVFRFKRTVRANHERGHDIVGSAAHHLTRYIEGRYGGIDRIPADRLAPIARLLGTPKRGAAILLNLHARGACSLSPPESTEWHDRTRREHRSSLYFDPKVVGLARAKANITAHIAQIVPDLTALADRSVRIHVARLLQSHPDKRSIGAYCIKNHIVSPTPPLSIVNRTANESPFTTAQLYFDPKVVGASAATSNLTLTIKRTFPSLDSVSRDRTLCAILGCEDSLLALLRHLAAPRYLGSDPPVGTRLLRPDGRLTRYADERILGSAARPVFDQLFRATYKSVDDLPWAQPALARALGCGNTLAALAHAAIERGLLPGTLPDGHPWYRASGNPSRYFSPAVVGARRALTSLKGAVEPLVPKLDQILDLEEVAQILGVAPTPRAVARRCITLGITEGHAEPHTPIVTPSGELSLHLDPRVRRRSLALADLRMLVATQQLSVEDLVKIPQLAHLLRCEPSRPGIVSGLLKNDIQPYQGTVPKTLDLCGRLHPAFDSTLTSSHRWRGNMTSYLKVTYSSLDEIRRDRLLAEALGCPNTAVEIAKTIVANRLFSWRAPREFSLFGVPGGSMYVDEDVMGDVRRVNLNIRRSLAGRIATLDDVYQNEALASALRCERSATAIAAALIEREILSPKLPGGHPFTLGRVRSRYFEASIVGQTAVSMNIKAFLHRAAPTLDEIPMIDALCNTLNVERRRHALAAFLVHFEYIDWRIPQGHDVQRAGGSLYLNREVMTRAQLDENIRAHVVDRFGGDLTRIPKKSKSLASALGVPNKRSAITHALTSRGIIQPTLKPTDL